MTARKHHITPQLLQRLICYDAESGALTWLHRDASLFPDLRAARSWNTRYASKPALTTTLSDGYVGGRVFGQNVRAHRVAWAIANGEWPQGEIDHINGSRSDNRLSNLRDVDRVENSRNVCRQGRNTSGQLGVRQLKRGSGLWVATITVRKQRRHLGYFNKKSEAIAARRAAETALGFHTNHGRPQCQAY